MAFAKRLDSPVSPSNPVAFDGVSFPWSISTVAAQQDHLRRGAEGRKAEDLRAP
jgi:hypothetical protein